MMHSNRSKIRPEGSTVSKTTEPTTSVPPQPDVSWAFGAIGTNWWIGLYQPVVVEALKRLQELVSDLVEEYDARYSRFRPDSLVSKWAQEAGTYPLPPDAKPLLDMYRALYDATDGAVTPSIGQTLSDAGYDAQYSFVPKPARMARPPRWEDTLNYNDKELTLLQPALLDFGAAGKGYLVDLICQLLEEQGIMRYCVDGSGDMRYRNDPPGAEAGSRSLVIGMENPDNTKEVIGIAQLSNGALCGSAGNRRAWGGYTHIMNPFTLQSPRHIKALWVTADTAMLADGLTTALYFADPQKLRRDFSFAYALVHTDNSLSVSPDFPGQFFTA